MATTVDSFVGAPADVLTKQYARADIPVDLFVYVSADFTSENGLIWTGRVKPQEIV